MTQPDFDGVTYDHDRDHGRLTTELERVQAALTASPGKWWTLAELAAKTDSPESSVSARLRDLRKPKFGGHAVERRYFGSGIWEYRYTPAPPKSGGAG